MIRAAMRTGSWLTPERLRVYPALIGAALAAALIVLVATSHGGKDRWDRPLGVDFSGVWVAGQAVRAGHPAQPYDNAAHAAAQAEAFGPSDSFLPWPYPPFFLALAGLLAALPYLAALGAWQASTCLLYLAAVLRALRGTSLARRDVIVAALAFPAVTINLLHGQNGLLSAGLLALGGFCLPRRPLLAGLLLGLTAYKPQLALLVPVAIVAGGHWRAASAMVATVLAMIAATLLAFGPEPWQGFVASLPFTRHVILEAGGLESWKLQSAFAAVRLLGGPVPVAYTAQAVVALAVVASLANLWRGDADLRVKVAALLVAALLATPYAVDYDMVMLGPALAALVAYGMATRFPPYGRSLLALAWLMPLGARIAAMSLGAPVGIAITATLYVAIVRWSRQAADVPIAVAAVTR